MTPNRWTELFFLDEATAFAAGHRPCFECRRPDAIRFKNAWIRGNPSVGFDLTTRIGRLDDVIHRERTGKVTPPTMRSAAEIPDGTFVVHDGEPYLVHREKIHQWTPSNYLTGIPFPDEKMQILTPMSIVNAFAAGYAPHVALH